MCSSDLEQYYNDGGVSQAKATDPTRHLALGPESAVSSGIGTSGSHTEARTTGEDPAVGHSDGERPSGADGREDSHRAVIRG